MKDRHINLSLPNELVKRCVESFTHEESLVYDPYMGSGTVAEVSLQLKRCFIGSEISEKYCKIAKERIAKEK